jgi:RNA polymerase sigma-70 factor (ECF subfamily)
VIQESKYIRSLVENTRNGNRTAFEQLYKIHAGSVYAISIRLLGTSELAEENTTKVFLEVWRTRKGVRRDSPFILWLTAITVFFALDKLRNSGEIEEKAPHLTNALRYSPLDVKIFALQKMQRAVFVLKEIQHYKIEEIVDLISKPQTEVEYLLSEARKNLFSELLLNSPDALEEELNRLPVNIEPVKDLFVPVAATMEGALDEGDKSPLVKSFNEKSQGGKSNDDRKPFKLWDLFKKK